MMRQLINNLFLIILIVVSGLNCKKESYETGEQNNLFQQVTDNFNSLNPETGVNCWWWWLNSNVTREAITRDLEAMQKTLQADSLKPAGVVEDAPNLLAALGDGLSPTIFDGGQDPLDADGDKTTQIDAVTLDDMIHQAARGHQLVLQARDQLHLLQL